MLLIQNAEGGEKKKRKRDFLHTCVPTPVQDIQLEELR